MFLFVVLLYSEFTLLSNDICVQNILAIVLLYSEFTLLSNAVLLEEVLVFGFTVF